MNSKEKAELPTFHTDRQAIMYDIDDIVRFLNYMHHPHDSFEIESAGQRDGRVSIEIPDFSEEEGIEFMDVAGKVIPTALEECHPLIRRRDISVRFIEEIRFADQPSLTSGAEARVIQLDENSVIMHIVVSNLSLKENVRLSDRVATALFYILHEIIEIDYFEKAGINDHNSTVIYGDDDYHKLESEVIPNMRALRLLWQYYPDLDLGFDYEEWELTIID